MHLTIEQILWALVVASHLVLLIVIIGRDRIARFPWFTTAIGFSTAHLIADHLLQGKLTTLAFYWQSYVSLTLEDAVGLLVLVELLRQVFSSGTGGLILKPKGWIGGAFLTLAVAVGAVWLWGPWPSMAAMKAEPAQLPLLLVALTATKGQIFISLMTVQVALLLLVAGRRFGFGWRTHPQQIALGLSTNALGFLAVQGIADSIKRTVHLNSREQYERIVHLFTNLDNARSALWIVVLLWWIYWLWRDDSGSQLVDSAGLAEAEPAIADSMPTMVGTGEIDQPDQAE